MNFRIADTFTGSLARLTGEEQKAVKTTAFDLQMSPANPGMSFHKLDRAKDKNFWSVRVSGDIRLVIHKTRDSLLLCYVDHHDKAYAWAERRKLETHPVTGAAQLVELRERTEEIVIPVYVATERAVTAKAPLFASASDETLLQYGVPAEWLADVRAATEDSLFDVVEHLPQEAAEALLDLATGITPQRAVVSAPAAGPFEHPDAQRRFRVVENVEELERALDYPWEQWTIFLHPAQRDVVERNFNGPARVSGSAGTGKTVVALHRAVALARENPDARVLLTTYSDPLANALRVKLRRLIANEPRLGERIEVGAFNTIAQRIHERAVGPVRLVSRAVIDEIVNAALDGAETKLSHRFHATEWSDVVDEWQLASWEAYRDVARLGRRTRLTEKQREQVWSVFERVAKALKTGGLSTTAGMLGQMAAHFSEGGKWPYEFVVVDESQDLSVAQLRLLASIGAMAPNRLFFAGDLGQRIFQQPFSWKSLGIDIRGRSSTLKVNYRTSHQIRMRADRLLDTEIADVDGNEELRMAISVFNGPPPVVRVFKSSQDESEAVGAWLKARRDEGFDPGELAVFVRSGGEIDRARAAATSAELSLRVLDERVGAARGHVSIATMHLAKGLEFRGVVVMACDDEIVPLQARMESVGDDAELEEIYNTERNLLYVACTRARDQLLVTGVDPASEFLDDLHA